MLFQVAAISDNDRGPRYAETVLNSLHETSRQRQSVCLELGSHKGTVGLFVRVPVGLLATFTHDFADGYPGCTLTALFDEDHDDSSHTWSATLQMADDRLCGAGERTALSTGHHTSPEFVRELTSPALVVSAPRHSGCFGPKPPIRLPVEPSRPAQSRQARPGEDYGTTQWGGEIHSVHWRRSFQEAAMSEE